MLEITIATFVTLTEGTPPPAAGTEPGRIRA